MFQPKMGILKSRTSGVTAKYFCFQKQCWIMGIDQPRHICSHLGRWGILYLCEVNTKISIGVMDRASVYRHALIED